MSRVGKQPITILTGVTVNIKNGEVKVVGPKGELNLKTRPELKVEIKDNQILVSRLKDDRLSRSLHGLTRTLIANMVLGVTKGYSKSLKIVGIGYRMSLEGETLILEVGFSYPVKVTPPAGIKFEVIDNEIVKISGADKILVGLWTAKVRAIKPPEPFKGKGIRYEDEVVKIKPGKAGKVGATVAGGGGAK